jgi:hypothetical protein
MISLNAIYAYARYKMHLCAQIVKKYLVKDVFKYNLYKIIEMANGKKKSMSTL